MRIYNSHPLDFPSGVLMHFHFYYDTIKYLRFKHVHLFRSRKRERIYIFVLSNQGFIFKCLVFYDKLISTPYSSKQQEHTRIRGFNQKSCWDLEIDL